MQHGSIPKDRVLYCYLSDVLEETNNSDHQYDSDLMKLTLMMMYLGGEKL